MEKIQTAIAKARAAREGEAPGPEADLGGPATPDMRPRHAPPRVGAVASPDHPQAAPDRAHRDAEIEERWMALPVLQTKPGHLASRRIVTPDGGQGAAEFDVMRTRMLQQMRAQGWRRLAITSPGPRCGKTTVTLNLAFGLGRQRDHRTLVVEMDFRHPSIAPTLGIAERHRFSKVLEGEADLAENALRQGSNLAFATDRGGVRNPADLLQSDRAARAMVAIDAAYAPTIVLLDMPPLLVNDDAMAFMGQVDCVLIVAAAETTTIKEIDTCERMIAAQTNVLGVVLNKCRYMRSLDSYGDYS